MNKKKKQHTAQNNQQKKLPLLATKKKRLTFVGGLVEFGDTMPLSDAFDCRFGTILDGEPETHKNVI